MPWRALLAAGGYLTLLALIVLWPIRVSEPFSHLLERLDDALPGSAVLLELVANVALFLPVGAFLALLLPRRWRLLAIPIGFGLSVAIEITQAVLLPDRVAALSDIVGNTAGAILGLGSTVALLNLRRRSRP